MNFPKRWIALLLAALGCLAASLFVDELFGALLAFTSSGLSLAAMLLVIRSDAHTKERACETKEAER